MGMGFLGWPGFFRRKSGGCQPSMRRPPCLGKVTTMPEIPLTGGYGLPIRDEIELGRAP